MNKKLTLLFFLALTFSFVKAQTTTLDSVISTYSDGTNHSKAIYAYDERGNKVKDILYYWDSGINEWHGDSYEEYIYNTEDVYIQTTSYTWDHTNRHWKYSSKQERIYEDDMFTRNDYIWDEDVNNWELYAKREKGTNEQGEITLETSYFYENESIRSASKTIYEYDVNNNNILEISSDYVNGSWVGNEKQEYLFDGNSNKLSYRFYRFEGDWIKSIEENYTYDEAGNLISELINRYRNNSSISSASKKEYSYDENGNRTSYEFNEWDGYTWTGKEKEEATYQNNQKQSEIKYKWIYQEPAWQWVFNKKTEFVSDGNKVTIHSDYVNEVWVIKQKVEYIQSSNGDEETISYTYSNGEWLPASKHEKQYNTSGKVIWDVHYAWDTDQWIGTEYYPGGTGKRVYEYDENNNMTLSYIYRWDKSVSEWIGVYKDEYGIDENGNNITTARHSWDAINQKWKGSGQKLIYRYDDAGRLMLKVQYIWDEALYDWKGVSKEEKAFNNSGDLLLHATYEWDNNVNDWKGIRKYIYNFDWRDGLIINSSLYEWTNNDWYQVYFSLFYYNDREPNPSSLNNASALILTIVPNPVIDYFTLHGISGTVQLFVYDINGKLILNKEINQNEPVSVGAFTTGLYLIKVKEGDSVLKGKLIKK